MINKGTYLSQKCDGCGSYILEKVGSEYYCRSCLIVSNQFQQQLRVVPAKYESNCRGKRQLQNERKLNTLIREFTDKYRDISSPQQMNLLRQRLMGVKALTKNKKGSRQAAGVVVYFCLHEQIKLSCKQFCKKSNLSLKIFNQKYIIYHKLYRPLSVKEDEHVLLKQQQKIEYSNTAQKSESQQSCVESVPTLVKIQNSRHAVQIIFDQLFSKYYYRQKKQTIVEGLINSLENIDENVLKSAKYLDNPPLKLYYLLFAVVKSLGHKMTYCQYAEVVQKKAGYLLKRKTASEVRRIYQCNVNAECLSEVKVQQNNSTRKQLQEDAIGQYFN